MENFKTVKVYYFNQDGGFCEALEEVVPSEWAYDFILEEVRKRRKYTTLDMVVMDSGDGVSPYITPYLDKAVLREDENDTKGFFA